MKKLTTDMPTNNDIEDEILSTAQEIRSGLNQIIAMLVDDRPGEVFRAWREWYGQTGKVIEKVENKYKSEFPV